MARELDHDGDEMAPRSRRGVFLRLIQFLAILLVLLMVVVAVLWSQREQLADDYIAQVLAENGIAATYEIESIGPGTQVLRNIVLGDPAKPDLTIERAVVRLYLRFGLPQIEAVRLESPRLWGRVVGGQGG